MGSQKKIFFSFFYISLSLHIVFIFIFITKSFLNFEKKEFITPPSIRIDSVGLPDLDSKKNIEKKKQKTVSFSKKKKRKTSKKKLKKKKEKKKKQDSRNQNSNQTKKKENKGNILNSEGEQIGEEKLNKKTLSEIYQYTEKVKEQIRSKWNLPKYLTEILLIAQVELKINPDGSILHKSIHVSSGNDLFDSYILKAIEKATPYPYPPDSTKKYIQKGGFVLTVTSQN